MAATSCWKCLLRPTASPASYAFQSASPRLPTISSFSTSASLEVAKKKPVMIKKPSKLSIKGKSLKATKTLKIKKKAFVKAGRPPAPGERKALRNRIVLSNTNALEVAGLTDITPEVLVDSAQVGKVFGLPGPIVDQLRAVEAFKISQGWSLFRRPAVLLRSEIVQISNMMQAAETGKQTPIAVLDGAKGTGKSMTLLQAMAAAFVKGWIVINIPEARALTTAHTAYTPIQGTTPTEYSQDDYTAIWLGQIAKANHDILSKLQLTKEHNLSIPLQSNLSLARLAELGSRDREIAWPIFKALWSEITSEGRPPILMTLDGLSNIMKVSDYRSPDSKFIHSHDMVVVKHFINHFSGATKLPNGGVVLAATSKSGAPLSYAMSIAIQQKEDKEAGREITKADPWIEADLRSSESLKAAKVMKVKGLSKTEARGLMEYWAASGVLRQRVDERAVSEKWSLAGNGVVAELERSALRMRI